MKKYKYITADPFLCVAALLQIIVKTELNVIISQKEIGEHFGVYVPLDYSGDINNIIKTKDKNMWGIIIKENEINDFFKHYKLPLVEKYISICSIEDWSFEREIQVSIQNNESIICGFDYGYLFNDFQSSIIGHVALIIYISEDKNSVVLYDPGPKDFGIKTVKSIDLFHSIHLKKNGLWKISHIQKP